MKNLLKATLSLAIAVSLFSACTPAKPTSSQAPILETTKSEIPKSEAPSANVSSLKIGFAASEFNDKWLSYLHDSAKDEAAKLGAELLMDDAKADVNKQLAAVENFVNQKVSAIVIVPVNTDAVVPMVTAAKNANIPLVFVNRKPSIAGYTSYVGSNSKVAGILQMKYLAEKMGGKGKIAILMGDPGNESAIKRTEGFKEVLKKYPDIEIVAEDTAMWQRDKGLTVVENWLQSGKVFNALASNNDEMAIGGLKAIESFGAKDILVGGIDATPDALQIMKDGKLSVTVFQNADGQGRTAIQTAIKAAKGESVEPYIEVPFELVKPEDVDKYLALWGL